jgi:hypothetical protein
VAKTATAAKQPDIKIPKPPEGAVDDLIGIIRRALKAATKTSNKTVIGIHGSPTTGLKKIEPRIDSWGEWGNGEKAGMFSQIVRNETGGRHLEEINRLARHYADRQNKNTGSIYFGKQKFKDIKKYADEEYFDYSRVSEKPLKVKKELKLEGKTEEQQLAALEKFLKRQGIRIYK